MEQKDTVLRLPICNFSQIEECLDPVAKAKVLDPNTFMPVMAEGTERPKRICEDAVPAACPRILCADSKGNYLSCRLLALIESERQGDHMFMRLPCSGCDEMRNLHPVTETFVYATDTARG